MAGQRGTKGKVKDSLNALLTDPRRQTLARIDLAFPAILEQLAVCRYHVLRLAFKDFQKFIRNATGSGLSPQHQVMYCIRKKEDRGFFYWLESAQQAFLGLQSLISNFLSVKRKRSYVFRALSFSTKKSCIYCLNERLSFYLSSYLLRINQPPPSPLSVLKKIGEGITQRAYPFFILSRYWQ